MSDMVAQEFFPYVAKGGPDGRNLRNNVDAISILLDHSHKATDLAFDPGESLKTGLLDVFAHRTYPYTPMG
jgi:hypothetical protein